MDLSRYRSMNRKSFGTVFVLYLVLSLTFAQAALAQKCRMYELDPTPLEGNILIEYCKTPLRLQQSGGYGYFVYAHLPSGDIVELDVSGGGITELVNLQNPDSPDAASYSLAGNTLTISEAGALLLKSASSGELELSTENDLVAVSGTENCDILVEEKFVTERFIQLRSDYHSDSTGLLIDNVVAAIDHFAIYLMAVGGSSSSSSGGVSGCDLGPGGVECKAERVIEYPSFKVYETPPEGMDLPEYELGESTLSGGVKQVRQIIEITREGSLKGEKFILAQSSWWETGKQATKYADALYTLTSPKTGIGSDSYILYPAAGIMEASGKLNLLMIPEESGYMNTGLSRILNELAISNLLSDGAKNIYVGEVMGIGGTINHRANPYVGKGLKNLRFGPITYMPDYLSDKPIDWSIMQSAYNNYFFLRIKVRGTPLEHILFIEDENGDFTEGRSFYDKTFAGKNEEEVKDLIRFFEGWDKDGVKNRNIWGALSYEAKDMEYLRANIKGTVKESRCGCYRLSRFLDNKNAFDMVNAAGETKNFISLVEEFIYKAKTDFDVEIVVDIMGSSNYFKLTSESRPGFLRTSDIDLMIHPRSTPQTSSYHNRITLASLEFRRILQDNGFEVGGTEVDPTFTIYEDGKAHTLKIDRHFDYSSLDSMIKDLHIRKISYPDGWTIVGNKEAIEVINNAFEEVPDTQEIRKAYINWILDDAELTLKEPVSEGDLNTASKRAALAARVAGTTEGDALADEMINRFDAGTLDTDFLSNKIAEIRALEISLGLRIIDAYRVHAEYVKEIKDSLYTLREEAILGDANKAQEVIDDLTELEARVKADTILTDEVEVENVFEERVKQREYLMNRLSRLKNIALDVKFAVSSVKNLDALEDEAVRNKLAEAETKLIKFDSDLTAELTLVWSDIAEETESAKDEFDKLPEEEKAKWKDKIKERASKVVEKLEKFVDYAKIVKEKLYESEYTKRVFEAMDWTHEKLEKLGRSKAGRAVAGGAALIYVLGDEASEKIKRIGELEDNPFLVNVGNKIGMVAHTSGAVLFIGFVVATLLKLRRAGVLAAARFTVFGLVGWEITSMILRAGVRLVWCFWLKKWSEHDPICSMFFRPRSITLNAEIVGTSGTCTMKVAWNGQSELNCV